MQAPTTLLAQVDSSVGGKVAVNHPRGKNLLGAFYQPELVMIDCDTLKTLDARQVGAGLGEVIKYGCIADEALFEKIERLGSREALAPELDEIIARCCAIKARYVHEDPHDHGVRMQLNFGHTLAHALENTMGYGVLLHGEAVCIGMVAAAGWGEALSVTPAGTARASSGCSERTACRPSATRRLTRAHSWPRRWRWIRRRRATACAACC
ncbi:MAG: 3-dehydroquinate synthase family protein [Christensenellales bacterium]